MVVCTFHSNDIIYNVSNTTFQKEYMHHLVWHWHEHCVPWHHKCTGVVAWVQEILSSHSNHRSHLEFRGSCLELPVFNHWAMQPPDNYLPSQWYNALHVLLGVNKKTLSICIQIEDFECWWLSSCCSSVAEYWELRGSIPVELLASLYFSHITSIANEVNLPSIPGIVACVI